MVWAISTRLARRTLRMRTAARALRYNTAHHGSSNAHAARFLSFDAALLRTVETRSLGHGLVRVHEARHGGRRATFDGAPFGMHAGPVGRDRAAACMGGGQSMHGDSAPHVARGQ